MEDAVSLISYKAPHRKVEKVKFSENDQIAISSSEIMSESLASQSSSDSFAESISTRSIMTVAHDYYRIEELRKEAAYRRKVAIAILLLFLMMLVLVAKIFCFGIKLIRKCHPKNKYTNEQYMESMPSYIPWSTNADESSAKSDGTFNELVASILNDKPLQSLTRSDASPWAPMQTTKNTLPSKTTDMIDKSPYLLQPSSQASATNLPTFNRLHRLGSAPTFGSDNNSFGLSHHNSTSNLHGYNDLFKLADRSCNLDYTNSSFADGLSGLIMKDKERQMQESNFTAGGGGDYINSLNIQDCNAMNYETNDIKLPGRYRNQNQKVDQLKQFDSNWASFPSSMGNPPQCFGSQGDGNEPCSLPFLPDLTNSYFQSTPNQPGINQHTPDARVNELQEHLIQRKFRELGLGNGTPPLLGGNTEVGHRQTDFSDLQLRRLDPVKQQTTPRKILNSGYSNFDQDSAFPSPIEPVSYISPDLREIPTPCQLGQNLFRPILSQQQRDNVIGSPWRCESASSGIEMSMSRCESKTPLDQDPFLKHDGAPFNHHAEEDQHPLLEERNKNRDVSNILSDSKTKIEQKDYYAPSTTLGGYMMTEPPSTIAFSTKGIQQYNKFIRPPPFQQNPVIHQNLPAYLPQPMMPQFFYPSSYPPLNPLDPTKYPFSDPQALFNTAASVGFPPNKDVAAMFPPMSGVKGWPMITFDNMGNPIPIPRMYGTPPPSGSFSAPPALLKSTRTFSQNKLYIAMEECYDQYRSLEKERKKVMALLDRMEHLLEGPMLVSVSNCMEVQYRYIREAEACRRDEINSFQHSPSVPAVEDNDMDTMALALADSLERLTTATRKARTALWVALQITLNLKSSAAKSPGKSPQSAEDNKSPMTS